MIKLQFILLYLAVILFACKQRNESNLSDISYDGKRYPKEVNLENQFNPVVQLQRMGNCHIHSAVAVVEAACQRATGKYIDLSEDYLTYRHIRSQLGEIKTLSIDKMLEAKEKRKLFYGKIEAGFPVNTIQRVFNNSVCTEKEFKFDTDFVAFLQNTIDDEFEHRAIADDALDGLVNDSAATREKLKDNAHKYHSQRLGSVLCEKMDGKVFCNLPDPKNA